MTEKKKSSQIADAPAPGASDRRTKLLYAVIAVSLVAISVSGYLTRLYYQLKADPGVAAFCNISAKVDCTSVVGSKYGNIIGIPISTFGALAYIIAGVWALLALKPRGRFTEHAPAYILLLGLTSTLVSFYLLYIMATELDTFCVMCGTLYLCNFALFGLGYMLLTTASESLMETLRSDIRYVRKTPKVAAAIGALALITGGALAAQYHRHTTAIEEGLQGAVEFILSQSPITLDEDGNPVLPTQSDSVHVDMRGRPTKGNPKAKVGIIEFADYRCPACMRAHEELKKLHEKRPDDYYLIFANFPLDTNCNKFLPRQVHANACEAAFAALCAGEQNKYWEYNDTLFTNQKKWESEEFRAYARELSLDMDKFESCMVSPRLRQSIERDIELGLGLGVESTPTLYINGYRTQGALPVEALEALLDQFEGKAPKKVPAPPPLERTPVRTDGTPPPAAATPGEAPAPAATPPPAPAEHGN